MVAVAVAIAFGTIQAASFALNASAAVPGALPRRVPIAFGLRVYRALARVAPAPYVETTLARYALAHGRLDAAEAHAALLPPTPVRDALLADIARARGQTTLALEYDLAAPDAGAVQRAADALAVRDPRAAYRLEAELAVRLERLATHPDELAGAYWRMGVDAYRIATRAHAAAERRRWSMQALRRFDAAAALAPLDGKYLLAQANQAIALGKLDDAQRAFAQALAADPASADALAGLGVVALRRGDRARAQRSLRAARQLDPRSGMVRALERDLRTLP